MQKKKHHVYNLYRISYTLSFCYVIYYIVSEIFIGERFLEDGCYCHSQQFIYANTIESQIHQKHRTFNIATLNTNPNQTEQKIFSHANINNKNTCKIVCKKQCLKNSFKSNASEGSISSIKLIHKDVFDLALTYGMRK